MSEPTITRIPTPAGIPEPGTVNGRPGYFSEATEPGRSTACCSWELADGSVYSVPVGGWERLTGWNNLPPPGNDWLPEDWPLKLFPLGPHPLQIKHWLKQAEWTIGKLPNHENFPKDFDDPDWGWRAALCAARLLASRYAPNAALTGRPYPTDRAVGLAEFMGIRDAINQAMAAAQPTEARKSEGGKPAAGSNLPGTHRGTKGKNIDARMLKVMAENFESHGWSASKWATHLSCSPGTVKETKTWKERLKAARATAAADSARKVASTNRSGRRKPQHKSEA
jgi:hypothetical protein